MQDIDTLILYTKETHRQRNDLLKAQSGLTLRVKAICRRAVPETDKHPAGDKTVAGKIYKALMSKEPMADDIAMSAYHLIEARAMLKPHLARLTKEMEKTAKLFPVSEWVKGINGFGWLGLAQIIAESGNLDNYSNPAKLWKRFGLAPFQGKAPSQWRTKGGLTAENWVEIGYSPIRRSLMFSVGDSLIKKQNTYRELYLSRKEEEKLKAPELQPMAHHRRAQRYMEKRLLRNLWKTWCDA